MKKIIVFILVFCTMAVGLFAKPARRDALTLTQPDGTQLTAYQHGDAFFHYYTDIQGNMLEQSSDGYYHAIVMPLAEELEARRMNNPRRIALQQMVGGELNLAPRGLIILVNFTNLEFKTTAAEIDSMLNGQNYTRHYSFVSDGRRRTITSSGSARQYFQDNSFGQYNPVFDVVGPVTLSQSYSYYGKNNASGNDQHADSMIKEACELVDDQVDFAIYDNNNDGKVDFVYVLYAGYGEADGAGANYVWPHNFKLSYSQECTVDGKLVDNYACSNEVDYASKQHDGIGTFCHEFSHVLGLPDLYATEKNLFHKTLGMWDILDYGPYNNDGNTPPCYSAYERFYVGWLKPTVINKVCDVQLPALHESNAVVLLTSKGTHNLMGASPNPTTFYLLENRQQEGWDKYLPGHGLLVTKITYNLYRWMSNTVNNSPNSMGVDLIEADGEAPKYSASDPSSIGYFGKAEDAYPAGSTSFTALASYQVTDIREEDGVVFFQVNGGGETIALDVENTLSPNIPTARKVFRGGQILIEHNDIYYDLLGNRH